MDTLRYGLILLGLMVGLAPASAQEKFFVVSPKTDITVTDTATLISAEDSARVLLSCTNNDTNIHVRWGDSTVTATMGQRLPAGTSIEIKARGAVYMISESTDVSVSCTEEAS